MSGLISRTFLLEILQAYVATVLSPKLLFGRMLAGTLKPDVHCSHHGEMLVTYLVKVSDIRSQHAAVMVVGNCLPLASRLSITSKGSISIGLQPPCGSKPVLAWSTIEQQCDKVSALPHEEQQHMNANLADHSCSHFDREPLAIKPKYWRPQVPESSMAAARSPEMRRQRTGHRKRRPSSMTQRGEPQTVAAMLPRPWPMAAIPTEIGTDPAIQAERRVA